MLTSNSWEGALGQDSKLPGGMILLVTRVSSQGSGCKLEGGLTWHRLADYPQGSGRRSARLPGAWNSCCGHHCGQVGVVHWGGSRGDAPVVQGV